MRYILLLFISATLLFAEAAEENTSMFTDPEDGSIDLSGYLSSSYGFLPVPTIITEPAVGFGAAAGILYLHDKFDGKESASGRNVPPSISGVILAGTENGTRAVGGFHMGHWNEDTLRTTTVALKYDVNMDLYTQNGTALGMNGDGNYFYQSVKFRILESDLFLGGNYTYGETTTTLDDNAQSNIPLNATTSLASLALTADYDSRDNTFSPNEGMLLSAQASFFLNSLGGDDEFQRYQLKGLFYQSVYENLFVDLKVDYEAVSGEEAPFYMFPFIDLRGIPVMRYQGQNTLASELQIRWEFDPRWSVLAFGGIGKAYGDDPFNPFINTSFSDAKNQYSKGVGFRYLIAKKYGLRMGIDIASSQDDEAVYLQFGTAWAGL